MCLQSPEVNSRVNINIDSYELDRNRYNTKQCIRHAAMPPCGGNLLRDRGARWDCPLMSGDKEENFDWSPTIGCPHIALGVATVATDIEG